MLKTHVVVLRTDSRVSFSSFSYWKTLGRIGFLFLKVHCSEKSLLFPFGLRVDPRRHQSIALKSTFSYVKMDEYSESAIKFGAIDLHQGENHSERPRWWNLHQTGICVPPTALKVSNSSSWYRKTPWDNISLRFAIYKESQRGQIDRLGLRHLPGS